MSPWNIVFWQDIVSPHQRDLLAAIGRDPRFSLTHMVVTPMTSDRTAQGWTSDEAGAGVRLVDPPANVIEEICRQTSTVHVHQGLKRLGFSCAPLKILARRQAPFLCAVERPSIDVLAPARRLKHRLEVSKLGPRLNLLCAGRGAAPWFSGVIGDPQRIFDYAYFLDPPAKLSVRPRGGRLELVYAGQLIARKRVDLLLTGLGKLAGRDWRLQIIGDGPLRQDLSRQARGLDGRVEFLGAHDRSHAMKLLASVDVLVLPSDHDGWGAVIEEALGAGTVVVASDACGASALISSPRFGEVFAHGDAGALGNALQRVSERVGSGYYDRAAIMRHGAKTSGRAGADYLAAIVNHLFAGGPRPEAPWLNAEDGIQERG